MHDITPGAQPPEGDPTRTVAPNPADGETAPAGATREVRAVVPLVVGRYQVAERLGSGGYGTVYRGYDAVLARQVAVKVFHGRHAASADELAAYLAEGRALASLDHPGIVPVYDVGRTDDGLCYLVSRAVDGGDLKSQQRRARPTRAEAVAIVTAVAEALHYAHQRGIVHRDVKPANILLDDDGRPYVGDFGQALREEEFGTGAIFTGTPAYMSPEQARGEGHRVDARTDVYSLGVVLYELLTGQVPYQAADSAALLEQIKTCEPRSPRALDPTLPWELERICLKALRKRASERYQTALALAEDLRHYEMLLLRPGATVARAAAEPRLGPIVPRGLRSFEAADADFFLDLLPGPRDRNGLPESIRFWKARLEGDDPDEPLRVGVIYGPSGCGKSSLVKAGLLPRLADSVIPIYVEATPDDLETRLLNGLRRRCPGLPATLGLTATLAYLRRGAGVAAGRRVVFVLDQFEQWLQARGSAPPGELALALRQCDGERVQALVLVRDDFWLAVSRFMRDLEIPLVEGRNIGLVDLFDPAHARPVLAEFGRAFGCLPPAPAPLAPQQEQFLDQAVTGLSQDGQVIPVHLTLFAEMTRTRPWTPATLRAVGGTEGIGVLFLEESLGSRAARPEHRRHQQAARAVLRALLPEQGTNIKGAMRSRAFLLAASGYARRPDDFDALLRVLDTDLRLITPTEPEGAEEIQARSASEGSDPAGQRYYQLTHDYLVPALRDWLTRRQRETRRGRAELCLGERAALWTARPERRTLPSGLEWLSILLFTVRKDWTAAQGRMMRAATRRYALRLVLTALAIGLLMWGTGEGYGYLRAVTLVRVLRAADTADTPETIRDLAGYRRWADPMLRRLTDEAAPDSRERLHASLALLPSDRGQIDYLLTRLLQAGPRDLPVIREALRPYAAEVSPRLWQVLESDAAPPQERFNAGLALAGLDPTADQDRWRRHTRYLVDRFLATTRAEPSSYAVLSEALRPARLLFLDALASVCRDRRRPDYDRLFSTTLIADFAADRPEVLADLLKDADAEQYAVLLPRLLAFPEPAAAAMNAELVRELRPDALDAGKESLARRQANAAVTLLHLGQSGPVWSLFQHRLDPRLRSLLIHRLAPLEADPRLLTERLLSEPEVSARRALILSLGEYPPDALTPAAREPLLARLQQGYETDPDPGIHAAIAWLLRRWDEAKRLAPVDERLKSADPVNVRRWYVNQQGQTFAVIRGPVAVDMGSPPDEPDRENEPIVHRRIDRSFALATTPVTMAQFQRFLKARNWTHNYTHKYCPDPECPAIAVNWFTAVQYCRWLSEQEGVLKDDMCYPPIDDIKEGIRLPDNYLSRTGYRLPTEAEWEFACRAGAVTSRYYGSSAELLARYGWYAANSEVQTHPVGSLKPNDFGLFDMHGNIWEWCQERAIASRPWGGLPAPTEDREDTEPVVELHGRVQRGGAFYDHPAFLRSAARLSNRPYMIDDYFGLRVARTIR